MHPSILKKIRLLRSVNGFTQLQLASKLNMSQNAYSMIECGKTKLDQERILLIAEHLDIEPNELLKEEEFKFEGKTTADSEVTSYKEQLKYLKQVIEEKDKQLSLLLKQNNHLLINSRQYIKKKSLNFNLDLKSR